MTDVTVTGVLPRAHVILNAIAAGGSQGIRLKDLADRTGIARPTVHRMLQDLADIGFVAQSPGKQYTLGRELFWLGLAAPFAFPAMPALRALAEELAAVTHDTVYVSMREASGVRYLLRVEGDYPLQSRVVSPGELKSFTSSYSGLALLATMPTAMQESALAHIEVDGSDDRPAPADLKARMRAAFAQVHERGWCTGPGLVMSGLSGLAAPAPNPNGLPVAAVSISAADTRLTPERATALAPALLDTAARMGKAIASAG